MEEICRVPKNFLCIFAKSTLVVSEFCLLDHKITKDGIFVLPEQISAINELPEPSTIKELRHALGLINFQRRFIKNVAQILVPLTNHLQEKVKNDDKIRLTTDARKAFPNIKHVLAGAAGLAHPRNEAKLRLYTDASFIAVGGVLVQKLFDNNEQALANFSKALNETQKKYSVFVC